MRTCGNISKTVDNFFNQIIRSYYEFLSTLDYEFLFS